MDFLKVLKSFTESLDYTPPVVNIGGYNENADSLAIRPAPSSIESRYIDKGKVYPFSFQVLVHHKDNMFAYDICQKLMNEYEGQSHNIISENDSFILTGINVTTLPSIVEETTYGTLWTALYEAELYIKKEG